MSLFKVLRGSEANLPTKKTDGWAYFCTDTGSFLIDHLDSGDTLIRSKISAEFADKLRYIADGETIELDPREIATHTYVQSEIENAKSYTDTKTSGLASINYVDASIENIPAITTTEIDEICGATIMAASEVLF